MGDAFEPGAERVVPRVAGYRNELILREAYRRTQIAVASVLRHRDHGIQAVVAAVEVDGDDHRIAIAGARRARPRECRAQRAGQPEPERRGDARADELASCLLHLSSPGTRP